jgi:calcium-dependent protein kinase
VKSVRKHLAKSKPLEEVAILKTLDHPYIIKLYEIFDHSGTLSLVFEYCPGGSLMNAVHKVGHCSELVAATLAQQMLRAIFYLHSCSVCHRHLTLDSFLCCNELRRDGTDTVKLTDFGSATFFKKGREMTTKVGSPHYMSPQVIMGRYDESCDHWSCGVMLFVLLCGYPPFSGESESEVLQQVKRGDVEKLFQSKDWQHVSSEAKQVVSMLAKTSPAHRYTAEQALDHVWIRNKTTKASDLRLHEGFMDHLRCYSSTCDFKKAALSIISGQLVEEHLRDLRDTFTAFDSTGHGIITVEEMRNGFHQVGIEDLPSDFDAILDDIDLHKSGAIDYTEFLAAFLEKRQYLKQSVCWRAFNVFDRDHDGHIDPDELTDVLSSGFFHHDVNAQAVEEIIRESDNSGDGKINFEEFMLMMLRDCSPRRQSRNESY